MKTLCGKLCGFCSGVNYTVNRTKELLANSNYTIYSLGEIVHNERVIDELKNKGLVITDDIEKIPNYSTVIFRAHGEEIETYEKAIDKNLNVIDLTCGKIKIIRSEINKYKNDYYILIIGKKNHPETIGTASYAGENSCIIENLNDVKSACQRYKESNLNKIYIVSQTTFSSFLFDEIVEEIKSVLKESIIINKSICNVTENRQNETMELSKKVDKMIIIGGKNSSNTKELEKIALRNCDDSILIQSSKDLKDVTFKDNDIIGIVTGASTPKEFVEEVIDYINKKESIDSF